MTTQLITVAESQDVLDSNIRFYQEALEAGLTRSTNLDDELGKVDQINTDAVKFLAGCSFSDQIKVGEKSTSGALVDILVRIVDATPDKTLKNKKLGKVRKYLARWLEAELGESPDRRVKLKVAKSGLFLEIVAKENSEPSLMDEVRALVQKYGFDDVELTLAAIKAEAEAKVA